MYERTCTGQCIGQNLWFGKCNMTIQFGEQSTVIYAELNDFLAAIKKQKAAVDANSVQNRHATGIITVRTLLQCCLLSGVQKSKNPIYSYHLVVLGHGAQDEGWFKMLTVFMMQSIDFRDISM